MKIIDKDFGRFQDVEHLNKRFIHGRTKQKITIDVVSPEEDYKEAYDILEQEVQKLFPALQKHDCGTNTEEHHEVKGPFNKFQGVIDIVHVIEHIMIDLLCTLTDMKMCSGITCRYWKPSNRYDIFVESTNQKVSSFAAYFATTFVREIIAKKRASPQFSVLLEQIKQSRPERDFGDSSFVFNAI